MADSFWESHEVRKVCGLFSSSWMCLSGVDWLGRQTPITWINWTVLENTSTGEAKNQFQGIQRWTDWKTSARIEHGSRTKTPTAACGAAGNRSFTSVYALGFQSPLVNSDIICSASGFRSCSRKMRDVLVWWIYRPSLASSSDVTDIIMELGMHGSYNNWPLL